MKRERGKEGRGRGEGKGKEMFREEWKEMLKEKRN